MNAIPSLNLAFQPTVSISAGLLALLLAAASLAAQTGPTNTSPPSVVNGKPAGIDIGDCAPNFQLEPVELGADFKRWLGDKAPKKFEDKVILSDFVGKAPIVLLFGSFT